MSSDQAVVSKDVLGVQMFLESTEGLYSRLRDSLAHPLLAQLADWTKRKRFVGLHGGRRKWADRDDIV